MNFIGGPQLRDLVTDPSLLKSIPCPKVTIRVDGYKGTGYNRVTGQWPSYGNTSGSSRAPFTSHVVTFDQTRTELPDFEQLPSDLRRHPGNEYRFVSPSGGSLKEYSEAVQISMWPESEPEPGVSEATHTYSPSIPGAWRDDE